jgi:hypothetical protein
MAKDFKEHKIFLDAVCPGYMARYPGMEKWAQDQ